MAANSGNPALGIGQAPGVAVATNGEAEVACAIWCCDKKAYSLPNSRGGQKTCQRLAHRKHSCVTHRLREKTAKGKLTQKNKFSNIYAAPRCNAPGISRTLIPDAIVGNVVIDAKFPCKTSAIHGPGDTPPGTGPGFPAPGTAASFPSAVGTGLDYIGDKELKEYTQIPGIKKAEAMTPDDAAKKKGECKC